MPGLEWVAPAIAGVFAFAGVLATVIISSRTSKSSNDASKAPTAEQAWREADRARAVARVWEDLYYLVRGAFKGYGRRMAESHGEGAALNDKERAALETPVPETEGAS